MDLGKEQWLLPYITHSLIELEREVAELERRATILRRVACERCRKFRQAQTPALACPQPQCQQRVAPEN
jgi:hypothetical protein